MLTKPVSIILLLILIMGIAVVSSVNYQDSLAALADSSAYPVAVVPIYVTNTQNMATPNTFQVMINVSSSEFAAYEAADLSNVAFSYPNGTLIPSWLESGNSNNSPNTVYWLKINSIPAGSNVTILMDLYPITDNVFNRTSTGEAPTLSPQYGEYDDGHNVFVTYGDFMNSFDGWQAYQYTGDFVPQTSPDGVEMLDASHWGGTTYLVSPSALPPSPTIVEEGWSYSLSAEANIISMFGMSLGGSSTALITSEANAPVLNNSISVIFDYGNSYTHINDYATDSQIGGSSFTGFGDFNVTSFLAVNGTWAWAGYSNSYMSLEDFNWSNPTTSAGGAASNPFSNSALIVSASNAPYASTQYIRWILGRTMPPNDIEPSVTIGNVVTAPTTSILSPEDVTYNVTSVPLTFTVDQPTSWMGYSLDGQSNITISGNTTLTGLTDGVHNVVVFANNTLNVMGVSTTTVFTIQTVAITNLSQKPLATNVTPNDIVSVNATVTDSIGTVTQVSLNYTSGNGTWITANMTNLQGNIWTSTIPAFPYGTNITYIIAATDSAGTVTTQQLDYTLQYTVVPEFTALPIAFLLLITTLVAALIRTRKRPGALASAS